MQGRRKQGRSISIESENLGSSHKAARADPSWIFLQAQMGVSRSTEHETHRLPAIRFDYLCRRELCPLPVALRLAADTHRFAFCSSTPHCEPTTLVGEYATTKSPYCACPCLARYYKCLTATLEIAAFYQMLVLCINTDWLAVAGRRVFNSRLPCMR
jgi:hypothetical protein